MFLTLITDCHDSATFGRQLTRLSAIFKRAPIPVAISGSLDDTASIEAAGVMIDILDSGMGEKGIVLVNAAPRNQSKWPNGTPFGYFYYRKTLVVTTVDGYTLSLIKRFKLAEDDKIFVFDIPTVMDFMLEQYPGELDANFEKAKEKAEYIKKTQFRSFEFMPRVAYWKYQDLDIPEQEIKLDDIQELQNQIFWIDNFGNAKTSILPEDINFEVGKEYKIEKIGLVKAYDRLKDVPIGDPALIIGSSGIREYRFLEVVIQGQSAAKKYGLKVGDKVI
jgi:S-adenosyl-l-methionine hydroxide adenosyltransferase